MSMDLNPNDYKALLADTEQRIRTRQTRAVLAVNRENIELYWETGELAVQRQEQHLWGMPSWSVWRKIYRPNSQACRVFRDRKCSS